MYVVDMFILKVATFPKYFIEHFGFAREKHEVMCLDSSIIIMSWQLVAKGAPKVYCFPYSTCFQLLQLILNNWSPIDTDVTTSATTVSSWQSDTKTLSFDSSHVTVHSLPRRHTSYSDVKGLPREPVQRPLLIFQLTSQDLSCESWIVLRQQKVSWI